MAPDQDQTVVQEKPDALEDLFTYHPPVGDQAERYQRIRAKALELARVIDAQCPPGPDATVAIRKVREAVMTANAAIATNNAAVRMPRSARAGS